MHWPNAKAGSARSGFTLVELMVVLALIAMMSVLIIPEMRGTQHQALLRSTSRQLIGAFNVASSRAVAFNQTHRVRLGLTQGRYAIEGRAEDGQGRIIPVVLDDVPGAAGQWDNRVTVRVLANGAAQEPQEPAEATSQGEPAGKATANHVISFYPDGTADPAEIALRDPDGFRLHLRMNPITGRVQIVELGHD